MTLERGERPTSNTAMIAIICLLFAFLASPILWMVADQLFAPRD